MWKSQLPQLWENKMARLSEKRRKKIPKKKFVYSSKSRKGKKDKGKYPIDTLARARSALRLVGMHGTSEERARVRAAVCRKYGDKIATCKD